MSFWPFNAQNINSTTNLNRLLDLYYQHRTIPRLNGQQQDVQSQSQQNLPQRTLSPLSNEIYSSTGTSTSSSSSAQQTQDDEIEGDTESHGIAFSSSNTSSAAPNDLIGSQVSSATGEEEDEEPDSLKIDREFVYEVLDDASLLGELNRQNNRVIDFICFGYINEQHMSTSTILGDLQSEEPTNETTNDNELDEDGDVKTIHEETTNLTSPTAEGKNKHQQNGISILEVLVDVIVESIQWFEENESFLFQANNNSNDTLSPSNTHTEEYEEQSTKDQQTQEELSVAFNRIHVGSEILSSKIWLISESIVEEPALLTKLWSFLHFKFKDSSPSIQYFIKINEQLLESRPDQMLNFIRLQDSLVDDFMKHIDITIIMDFLLRIITTDKVDIPTGVIDLLSEQKLIPKLLDFLLTPGLDSSTQSSAGDFLKALISISANTSIDENTIGPNLLTKELVSETNVLKMIQIIKNRGNGLSTIVGVIIEIIRKNNSDYDAVNLIYTTIESHPPSKRDPIYLGYLLRWFSDSLNDFNDILLDAELSSKRYRNQIQAEFEPLGFERFKVCELIAELLHCSNIALLNNEMTETLLRERESFICSQEDNLANALNDVLEHGSSSNTRTFSNSTTGSNGTNTIDQLKPTPLINIPGKLPVIGAAEPSVALNADNVTISPNQVPNDSHDGLLPLHELTESNELNEQKDSEEEASENSQPKVVGDFFKYQLIKSGILSTVISMFVKFPWNNFWHNVVFDIVQQIFNGKLDGGFNPHLILELFSTCDITNLIIKSYQLCQQTEQTKGVRLGYMGHLVLIAEEVVKFSTQFHSIPFASAKTEQLIYDKLTDQDWVSYVTNVLTEIREQYNCVLGGIKTQNEFQEGDYLNKNVIVLGNSEEEILNQPVNEDEVISDDSNNDNGESSDDEMQGVSER